MNLPNKLTILRVILIPFFMFFILAPDFTPMSKVMCDIIAAVIFGIASFTDFLDGYIARKNNIVTNFGKFMDPIADKLMVFGAFLCFLVSPSFSALYRYIFAVTVFVVLLREFAVTSVRLVAGSSGGKVIAANMAGKVKTVLQIIFILLALLERHIFFFSDFMSEYVPLTCLSCIIMLIFTVISGVGYLVPNLEYLDPNK
ncbi:MAG: CDP-diacylglycerol--glycerol-3-phosphate 3-phosphatidyltransferase [Clostridia bacterium]|nr:CDP-diacylglycerol--glycerol-3-phosphate 3-phosphatidyltransferase [Clostridia bacterium]